MACEYKEFYESELDEFQKFGIIFLVINSAVTYFKILRKIDPYLIWLITCNMQNVSMGRNGSSLASKASAVINWLLLLFIKFV